MANETDRTQAQASPGSREPGRDAAPGQAPASAVKDEHAARGSARSKADRVEELEKQLEEARREAAGYLDDLKRLKAEFENYRKRVLKEQTAVVEFASARVIEKLLPVLDNFELALLAADQSHDHEKLVRGVEMVFGELLDVLHKEGLRKIEALGRPFDPEKHEAVMQAEGGGEGEPVVVDVLRPGYMVKDRVVRPAMVKVGRR